jgi:hypothetical protein
MSGFGIMNVEQWDIPAQERRFQFVTEYDADRACAILNFSGLGSTYIVVPVYECGGRIYLDNSRMEQEA